MHRLVASILHGRQLGRAGQWASALIYGTNEQESHGRSHSVLAETEIVLDGGNTFFGRAEMVQKNGEELVVNLAPDELFAVGHVSLGYIRELGQSRGATLGIGVRGTMNFVPADLESIYGSRTPLGGLAFLRVRPASPWRGSAFQPMEHTHEPPRAKPGRP